MIQNIYNVINVTVFTTASQISFPLHEGQEGKIIKHLVKEKLYIPVFAEKCELQVSILKCRVKA